jgi:hypothetical protein
VVTGDKPRYLKYSRQHRTCSFQSSSSTFFPYFWFGQILPSGVLSDSDTDFSLHTFPAVLSNCLEYHEVDDGLFG